MDPIVMLRLPGFDQLVARSSLANVEKIRVLNTSVSSEEKWAILIFARQGDQLSSIMSRQSTEAEARLAYVRLIEFLVDQNIISIIEPPIPDEVRFEKNVTPVIEETDTPSQ